VLIANQFNDATKTALTDSARFGLAGSGAFARILEYSAMYRFFRNLSIRPASATTKGATTIDQWWNADTRNDNANPTRRVPLADYAANLAEMFAMVRTAGGTPIMLILPTLSDVVPPQFPLPVEVYRETARSAAAEAGVQVIDGPPLFKRMRSAEGLFSDQVHPDVRGARLIAGLLDQQMPR
jgi:hypothetical protein